MPSAELLQQLENAYQRFESDDRGVSCVLALETAELDNQRFAELQGEARGQDRDAALAACEALAEIGRDIGSALLLDGVVASALDKLDAVERALELRAQALDFVPWWHPFEAGRTIGNIGWSLYKSGDHDNARVWLERALQFDPTDPFVLANLGCNRAATGDLEGARAIDAYLRAAGYPEDHLADLRTALGEHAGVACSSPYRPDLGVVRRTDREHAIGHLWAAVMYDRNIQEPSAFRAMALAAHGAGQHEYARLTAAIALEAPWHGDDARAPLEGAWARALSAALGATELPMNPEARGHTIDEAIAAGDTAALADRVWDPVPGLRWAVIAHLVCDRGSEDFESILETHARFERSRGIDTAMFEEVGWSASTILATRARRLGRERHEANVVPWRGSGDPLFEAPLAEDELLVIYAELSGPLSPPQIDALQRALQAGDEAGADLGEELGCELVDCVGAVALAFRNVVGPAAVLDAYSRPLRDPAIGVRGLTFARLHLPEEDGGLLLPALQPGVDYDWLGDDDWFARSFDQSAQRLPPEPEAGLFMMMPSSQGHMPEQRLTAVSFEDVHVVYGLTHVDKHEPNERAAEVAAVIRRHLDRVFVGCPPEVFNRDNVSDGPVDRIEAEGRNGYAFALQQLSTEMLVHYPGAFRLREHELMAGLRDAIAELGLAPVIHYARDGGVYIVNLWEA